jgi:uncharacterized MAPEG superfamily protein
VFDHTIMSQANSNETKAPQDPEIERMNKYTGNRLPAAIIPLTGAALGALLAYGVHTFLLKGGTSPKDGIDGLLALIQVAPVISGLFWSEFLFGAVARGESRSSAFSPAAASMVPLAMPLRLVESNRIHQNHVENAMIFLPVVVSASLVDSSWAIACTVSWTVSRVIYRCGYSYKENPMWRICGVSASMLQCMICAWIGLSGVTPPSLSMFL